MFLCFGDAQAASNPDAVRALKGLIKEEFQVYSEATGDLTDDGQADWVGIVLIKKADTTFQKIYVLTLKDNNLVFTAASKEVEYTDCGGSCGSEILEIKKGSFYVMQGDKGGWGAAGATTQFKLYKGDWRAIGYTTVRIDFTKNTDYSSDENLLTGHYTSTLNFINSHGKSITKNKKGHGKPSPLTPANLLVNFDLSQF